MANVMQGKLMPPYQWFFGRIMLAIQDEVYLRPGLEKVLSQFDSYLKQHADFLAALNEKQRQSWDNNSSPIGDLLIDKVCTPSQTSQKKWPTL
jgi:hypothetical protein